MGKGSLVLDLAHAIAGKSTFLQVARTATKGNVVQKGLELQGKKAIKFFEKMPCDFQRYVGTVNPENLTVRYGVKGYKGSSVTGFEILDSGSIIAKGAIGIDKTFGKSPILQMRVKLYQDAQQASLNFKYNGNHIFDGSAHTNSISKNGRFHIEQNYGETINFEYTETGNFSNWSREHKWIKWDNIEFPNAKQFAENEEQVHKGIKEFVGGRRTFTPEQRQKMLNEKALCRKERLQGRKILKEEKARINSEMQSEIANIERVPELKNQVEYNAVKHEQIKQLRTRIQASQKEVKALERDIESAEKKLDEMRKKLSSLDKTKLEQEYAERLQTIEQKLQRLSEQRKFDEMSEISREHRELLQNGIPELNLYRELEFDIEVAKSNLQSKRVNLQEALEYLKTAPTDLKKLEYELRIGKDLERNIRTDLAENVRAKYKAELDKFSSKQISEGERLSIEAEKAKLREDMQSEIGRIINDPELEYCRNRISENQLEIAKLNSSIRSAKCEVQEVERKIQNAKTELEELYRDFSAAARGSEVSDRTLYNDLCYRIEQAENSLEAHRGLKSRWERDIQRNEFSLVCRKDSLQMSKDHELTLLQGIQKRIKDVRLCYKAKLKQYSPKALEQRRLAELEKQEEERISEQLSKKSYKQDYTYEYFEEKINVRPYKNEEVINQIRGLQGSTMEVAEQSRSIFLKEMGFDPELVKIVKSKTNANMFSFELLTGEIHIPHEITLDNLYVSSLIRHELDHFQLFADLCKSMGIENFKKILLAKYPGYPPEAFNTAFWEKAIQNAKVLSSEDVTRYSKALKEYTTLVDFQNLSNNPPFTLVKYFGSPIETRAYTIEAIVAKSLNYKSVDLGTCVFMSKISKRICAAMDKIEQKTGKAIDEKYFNRMVLSETLKTKCEEIDIFGIYSTVLNRLENMAKA